MPVGGEVLGKLPVAAGPNHGLRVDNHRRDAGGAGIDGEHGRTGVRESGDQGVRHAPTLAIGRDDSVFMPR